MWPFCVCACECVGVLLRVPFFFFFNMGVGGVEGHLCGPMTEVCPVLRDRDRGLAAHGAGWGKVRLTRSGPYVEFFSSALVFRILSCVSPAWEDMCGVVWGMWGRGALSVCPVLCCSVSFAICKINAYDAPGPNLTFARKSPHYRIYVVT